MNNRKLSALLERYLNGSATADEIAIIDSWYQHYEIHPEQISTLSAAQKSILKNRMFNTIQANIEEEITLKHKVKPLFLRRWFQVAAILTICLSAKFFIPYFNSDTNNYVILSNQYIRIKNNSNQIIKQTLPDQSIVYLDPSSTITYPKSFAKNSRNISMKGACFFEITKNPHRPFVINSDRIVTKVWGTSLKITDQMTGAATVSVLTGKVSVVKKTDVAAKSNLLAANEVILHAMEKVSLPHLNAVLAKENNPNLSELSIWKHISLSFSGENLTQIVTVLNKSFAAEIIIGDKELNDIKMDADLSDLNLAETLEVLKASLNVDYQLVAGQIILTKKK